MNITIHRENPDKLGAEEWQFYVMDAHSRGLNVRLCEYSQLARPTRRHKYQDVRRWGQHNGRSNTVERNEVPEPAWLRDAIVAEVMKNLNFEPSLQPTAYCKACGASPGDECKTASTIETPADCINKKGAP